MADIFQGTHADERAERWLIFFQGTNEPVNDNACGTYRLVWAGQGSDGRPRPIFMVI